MKILVVTVYNSHNSGSFLQAYALQCVLRRMGCEVAYLKRDLRNSSHSVANLLRKVLKAFFNGSFSHAMSLIREWFVYQRWQKSFHVVDKRSSFYKKSDAVIIGSDTVWNFKSKYFRQNASLYCAKDVDSKRIIAYAVSAGNTDRETFNTIISKYDHLNAFFMIMVRDGYTKKLVESATHKKAILVSDPTLIARREDFESFRTIIKQTRPYILLYFFGEISDALRKQLENYASKHELDVISMPEIRSWCKDSIFSSPQNMISYFSSASAILTNTFHGTAFSIIYEKPFAVYDQGKKKVEELLSRYDLKERLFGPEKDLSEILSKEKNVVNSARFNSLREESLQSLKQSLED